MSLLSALLKPLAYVSLPVFLLHTASNASPLARYYVRLGLYLSTLSIFSVYGVLSSIGMSILGRRFDTNWLVARSFYNICGPLLGIRFVVEGEEHLSAHPAIILGNHQSMLDILYLGRIFPHRASITAKKELRWMPLLGQYMLLSGAIFIDRGNNTRAVKSIAEAGETMKRQRTSVWFFPEGTRTNRPEPVLRDFKKGAFYLAVEAGVPIIPVVCENYNHLYHSGTFEGGILKIKVLPPIPTTGLTKDDVSDLARRVREQMVAALEQISRRTQSVSPSESSGSNAPSKPPVIEPFVPVPSDHPKEAEPKSSEGERVISEEEKSVSSGAGAPPQPLAIDTTPSAVPRRDGSDKGADTEEDEGMVLVNRPDTDS